MGVDALRAAVESEGRERVAAIRSRAEAEAARLRHQAESAAAEHRRETLQLETEELRRAARARVAEARAAAHARVLEARSTLLERVSARARELLPATIASERGRAWLIELAEQALGYMPQGEVTVSCSTDVASTVEAALMEREGVRIEHDPDLPPGLRIVGGGGSVTVDATLPRLLELHRPRIAIGVLRRLEEWSSE